MNNTLVLDLAAVDRETALRTWLAYHKLSTTHLAQVLGVNPSFVTYLVQGKRRSRRAIKELVQLGVPAELLPKPGNGPGRPRA